MGDLLGYAGSVVLRQATANPPEAITGGICAFLGVSEISPPGPGPPLHYPAFQSVIKGPLTPLRALDNLPARLPCSAMALHPQSAPAQHPERAPGPGPPHQRRGGVRPALLGACAPCAERGRSFPSAIRRGGPGPGGTPSAAPTLETVRVVLGQPPLCRIELAPRTDAACVEQLGPEPAPTLPARRPQKPPAFGLLPPACHYGPSWLK